MKFRPILLALGFALAASVTMTARAEGNVPRGQARAYTCLGCHGIANYMNAFPNYSVPKLGGQNAKYIEIALKAYASGERAHPTMYSHASGMSDEARADIAAFFAGLGNTHGTDQVIGTPPPATQTCVACHGANGGQTVSDEYPKLAGQQADYLVQALKDYKSGKRKNPVMAGIVAGLDERDFEVVAQFFARQKGVCTPSRSAKPGCD